MQYFPIFVDTNELNVLVVGGGEVATRKIELLLKSHAVITVVSPNLSIEVQRFVDRGCVKYIQQHYHETHLHDQRVVFVATSDSALNASISQQAKRRNILANVVDSPALCHFITPSIIDRSPMVFAISSEGTAPVLVRYWRARLESLIPSVLGKIAEFSGQKRDLIKKKFINGGERRRFWERFFSSSESDNVDTLEPLFSQLYHANEQQFVEQGELYIVQVTDNEEMLSLAALRHMQQSDIALIDENVGDNTSELIRRDANIEALNQEDITIQVDALLRGNQRVCILSKKPLQDWQALVTQFEATYPTRQFNSALFISSS